MRSSWKSQRCECFSVELLQCETVHKRNVLVLLTASHSGSDSMMVFNSNILICLFCRQFSGTQLSQITTQKITHRDSIYINNKWVALEGANQYILVLPLSSKVETVQAVKGQHVYFSKFQTPCVISPIHSVMNKQEPPSPCGDKTVTGDANERLQNGISFMWITQREGWECLIQHLESIHQFLIDGNYCCGRNGA